jgi:hypothetical protein
MRAGFVGAKPPAWTRWVLDALGYDPERDEVVDLFNGSGAVAGALAEAAGVLPIAPGAWGSSTSVSSR